MEKILFQIALILVATKLGGLAAQKCKMPEVLGALIAGVLLGPVAFHLIEYDANISLLSNLGVILLMFLAGMETNLNEFKKAGFSAFMIAACGVAVPLIFGTFSAFLFFQNTVENIFIGVILTATSVSITVETLQELGKLNTRVGINILGAAVIDDILGLILISVLLATSGKGAGSTRSLPLTLVMITLFCILSVAAIAFLPKVLNRLMKDVKSRFILLTFSLAGAFLASAAAEFFGIAAITGAYLCGLMLSQFVHKETVERDVRAISSGFLTPIFFAGVGIEANLNGLDFKTLMIALVMFAVAVLGKILGCGLAARAFKLSRRESLQVGVGMISRGEVAIITANIGLQDGIISNEVFLPTIFVVILTTIITPVLLKLAFSKHRKTSESPVSEKGR